MKSLSDRVTEMGMEASWRVGAAAFSVFNEHRPHPDFMKGCELGAKGNGAGQGQLFEVEEYGSYVGCLTRVPS